MVLEEITLLRFKNKLKSLMDYPDGIQPLTLKAIRDTYNWIQYEKDSSLFEELKKGSGGGFIMQIMEM